MAFILIILSLITIEIRMVLNTEPILPTIMSIVLSDCTIVTTVEGHSRGNVLTIFATWSPVLFVVIHESETSRYLILSFISFVDYSPIHLDSTSSSTLIEVTGKNNPMNEDEAFKGLPHLWESELPANGVAQMDVHWAIWGEEVPKKFHCLWVECKKNYVTKQKN